jgi:hypothetical protein
VKYVIFRENLSAEPQEDFGLLNKIHFISKCYYITTPEILDIIDAL